MRRVLLAVIAASAACVEGDNTPPTVLVTAPLGDTIVSRGGTLPVAYADDDSGGATTSLYLEPAAALAGGGPYLIAADRPTQGPQTLTFRWDPAAVPAGEYHVVAVTSDGTTEVVGEAPGLVTLADVSRVRSDGGDQRDGATAVAALPDGTAFLTGFIEGTPTFGDGEAGETTLEAQGIDIFVARYRPDGTLAWAKRAGSERADVGQGIAAFADGSCVVTGRFDKTAIFGEGETNETELTALDDNPQSQVLGGREIFVARYNPDGTLAWAKSVRGPWFDEGTGIAALPDGSSVVTGWFADVVTFGAGEKNETVLSSDGGSSDIFVARYNADGTLAWAKRAGGATSDNGLGIAALPDGTSFVSGFFSVAATFGPGEALERTVTTTNSDAFVACYGPDGRFRWVAHAIGTEFTSSYAFAAGVAPDGSTVIAGRITGETTFGEGEANETTLPADPGDDEIFVARYGPTGTLLWAKRAGGAGVSLQQAYGIAALPDGSAVVTGQLAGPATFAPGEAGETELDGSAFLARYGPDGTLAWAKAVTGFFAGGRGVAVLPDESVLVTGPFLDTATFGAGEPGETSITVVPGDDETSDTDLFLALYNADGSF